MLKRKAEMTHESKKVWGGKGELDLCKILTPEELGGRAKLFNIVTVAPGQSCEISWERPQPAPWPPGRCSFPHCGCRRRR